MNRRPSTEREAEAFWWQRANMFGRGRIQHQAAAVREPQSTRPHAATSPKSDVITHSNITSVSKPMPGYWTEEKQLVVLNGASIQPKPVVLEGKPRSSQKKKPAISPKTMGLPPPKPLHGKIASRPDICTDKIPGHTSYRGYDKRYLDDLLARERDQPTMDQESW